MEDGIRPAPDATRIALYVHYAATGRISAMVRHQLAQLDQFGFAIVFISMAPRIPEEDWQAARGLCALVVQRQNFARDSAHGTTDAGVAHAAGTRPDELIWRRTASIGPIPAGADNRHHARGRAGPIRS